MAKEVVFLSAPSNHALSSHLALVKVLHQLLHLGPRPQRHGQANLAALDPLLAHKKARLHLAALDPLLAHKKGKVTNTKLE